MVRGRLKASCGFGVRMRQFVTIAFVGAALLLPAFVAEPLAGGESAGGGGGTNTGGSLAAGPATAPSSAKSDGGGERRLPVDASLVALDSPDGKRLLAESDARESVISLSMYFTTQDSLAYCGVASSTMVLNALDIDRPVSPDHAPYRLFTQRNFFNPDVRKVITPEQCGRSGMTLDVLGRALATFPVTVDVTYAKDSTPDEFRKTARNVLSRPNAYLVVNYLRKAIRQESGGHISPIGAYHAGEDRFLILDVARYKYPPVWVKTVDLWQAMRPGEGEPVAGRGYLVVSKKSVPAATVVPARTTSATRP